MGNNYQRLFYIFKNMDNDLGSPTGYIKVEINGETAKLQISLNNISGRQGVKYQLYGIKKVEQELKYTVICDIQNINGRAEIKLSTPADRVGSEALNFDDINIFAVIARTPERLSYVSCPLVAYKYVELQWKKQFEMELAAPTVAAKPKKEPEAVQKLNTGFSNIEKPKKIEPVQDMAGNQNNTAGISVPQKDNMQEAQVHNTDKDSNVLRNIISVEINPVNAINEKENLENNDPFRGMVDMERDENQPEPEPDVVKEITGNENERGIDEERGTEDKEEEEFPSEAANGTEPEKTAIDETEDISSKFESTLTSIYRQKEGMDFSANYNDVLSSAEKNFQDISSFDEEPERIKGEFDIQNLREELDRSFEICSPFKARSKRFQWWKINSPGYLNNILFRNNVKTYLLFNPKVMLAHYKYRYIIFGIRSDKYTGRERFICGVPGVYNIDENPFGSMGSWAQLEGYKPKYGAFGYWIILIDPRTGKLLKIK